MKKDIPFKKVKDVAIAVTPNKNDLGEDIWEVYIINMKDEPIEGVLISSKGYGTLNGKKVKTSILRQLFDSIEAESYRLIEPIQKKLFTLCNEFWLSFWYNGIMYDKKYIFVTDSIVEDNFTHIPVLEKEGVMIK